MHARTTRQVASGTGGVSPCARRAFGASGADGHPHLCPQWDVEKRAQSIVDEVLRDVSQRYKMQEELGAGAQATVYKATHRKNYGKVHIPAWACAARQHRLRGTRCAASLVGSRCPRIAPHSRCHAEPSLSWVLGSGGLLPFLLSLGPPLRPAPLSPVCAAHARLILPYWGVL